MNQEKAFDLHGRRIFIALPAYDFKVSIKMAISLVHFGQQALQHGVEIQIGSICGCSVVSRARNLLAQDFLESKCTDLLFIDSDINFAAEDVFRLLAWTTDKGIAAGVPTVRKADKTYIATYVTSILSGNTKINVQVRRCFRSLISSQHQKVTWVKTSCSATVQEKKVTKYGLTQRSN